MTSNSPARILFLTPLYAPAVGGAAQHFGYLCDGLARVARVERLVVVTETNSVAPQEESIPKGVILRWLPPWLSVSRGTLRQRIERRLTTQRVLRKIVPSLLRSERIDLLQIHSTAGYTTRSVYSSATRNGAALVGELQDSLFDAARFRPCDRVVCCSENLHAYAQRRGLPARKLRLVHIPFARPAACGNLGPETVGRAKAPYVCFVGDVTERKGIYELLSGFAIYRQSHPEERLVIAGPNHEGIRFTVHAKRAGVEYLGPLPHRAALALIQAAKLVVIPSKAEGLPRVCLETIALGKKVLLPPGIPEFDRNCRDFVLPGVTPEVIARKMEEVLASPNLPSFPFEGHDPARVTERYVSIYSELLGW